MTTMTDQDLLEIYDRLFTDAANIIMMCQVLDFEMRSYLLRISGDEDRVKIRDYGNCTYLEALDLLAERTTEMEREWCDRKIPGTAVQEEGKSFFGTGLLTAEEFSKLRELDGIWKYWAFDGFKYLMGEEVSDPDVYAKVLEEIAGKAHHDRICVREAGEIFSGGRKNHLKLRTH